MSDGGSVFWALFHSDAPFVVETLRAPLEGRGFTVIREAESVLAVTDLRHFSGQRITLGPRSAWDTVRWIGKTHDYASTKIGVKRSKALAGQAFDSCVQGAIDDVGLARAHEGLLVDVMATVQTVTNAWIYLRWNGRWLFPPGAKIPGCFT